MLLATGGEGAGGQGDQEHGQQDPRPALTCQPAAHDGLGGRPATVLATGAQLGPAAELGVGAAARGTPASGGAG
ncbi:hypothetical protein I6A84_20450 [Frankia sp. CNm7]|uniref:Uncharacterized protein n=1 Tax=Frankia nepalensis TaxID=1836974 RepID=A0A937RNM9_9ACTN|nr:hypothetical protein [Frankia nepalensis]MBL7495491.1 hypothetical protein [Frankia nepalensis]MBL7510859.1 hypothetical protein [Frankia nepalensis]MBL7520394.1 hypothetical protein [Frankia nepalensis]MBL7630594.1 hypothetical protein [Frankia nepalensis]